MILFNTAYGTVYKVEDKGKVVKCNLNTSDKKVDAEGNTTYETSRWFGTFMPKCADNAKSLVDGDRVKITSGKVYMQETNTEPKKYYPTVLIFDFEPLVHSSKPKEEPVEDTYSEEELPFR